MLGLVLVTVLLAPTMVTAQVSSACADAQTCAYQIIGSPEYLNCHITDTSCVCPLYQKFLACTSGCPSAMDSIASVASGGASIEAIQQACGFSSTTTSASSSDLSVGVIAGIVVGVLALLIGVVVLVIVIRRRRSKKDYTEPPAKVEETEEYFSYPTGEEKPHAFEDTQRTLVAPMQQHQQQQPIVQGYKTPAPVAPLQKQPIVQQYPLPQAQPYQHELQQQQANFQSQVQVQAPYVQPLAAPVQQQTAPTRLANHETTVYNPGTVNIGSQLAHGDTVGWR